MARPAQCWLTFFLLNHTIYFVCELPYIHPEWFADGHPWTAGLVVSASLFVFHMLLLRMPAAKFVHLLIHDGLAPLDVLKTMGIPVQARLWTQAVHTTAAMLFIDKFLEHRQRVVRVFEEREMQGMFQMMDDMIEAVNAGHGGNADTNGELQEEGDGLFAF